MKFIKFNVMCEIPGLAVTLEVNAENLEQALTMARKVDVTDLLAKGIELIDGHVKLTGIYE